MNTCRIFLSSPSDVASERASISRVMEKLRDEWRGRVAIELIDWNENYYSATSTFQKQIARPSDCDLVVCVFWKRLGSELPEEYRREDGTLPTGSEYEFEDAIEAATKHASKLPDVFVYRKMTDVVFSIDRFELEKSEYERFLGFWRRWFRNEQGHFTAAFQSFKNLGELASQFENNVRRWLDDRYGTSEWTKGSPYRGLAPFLEDHHDIFFGRRREIERARARLVATTLAGLPALVVTGASGSGKSSLVRAGLVPRLKLAGGVPGMRIVASVTAAPGELAENWPLRLAALLFESPLGAALAQGDSPSPDLLARALAAGDVAAGAIAGALNRLTPRKTEGDEGAEEPALLLLVDQLEEIFSWPHQAAEGFFRLVEALVASRRVIFIATMRSDFQHRLAEFDALSRLVGRLDVRSQDVPERIMEIAAPSEADLFEIIERPAAAAGLSFEVQGERDLCALIKAQSNADSVPAVELLLQQLYETRDGNLLTLAAFDRLGGVLGVMATLGESVLAKLEPEAVQALPQVVRALATQSRPDSPTTTRRVSSATFAHDPNAAKLVDALVDAGLITSDRGLVKFAHESLFTHWDRIKTLITENRRFFDVRERVERDCERWIAHQESRHDRTASLLQGLSLEEGRELLAKWGPQSLVDRQPLLPEYIQASARRANWLRWRLNIFAIAAVVVSAISLLALQYADRQKREVRISLALAEAQDSLRGGDAAQAMRSARDAFEIRASSGTRSTLLSALMVVSPYYVTGANTGTATPQVLTWADASTLVYVDSEDDVHSLSLAPERAQSWQGHIPVERGDGDLPRLVAVQRVGSGLLGVLNTGAVVTMTQKGTIKLTNATSAVISTAAGSFAAISGDGAMMALASITDPPVILDCSRDASDAYRCTNHGLGSAVANAVELEPSKNRVALATASSIAIVDARTAAVQRTVTLEQNVSALKWNPRHDWLAAGLANGQLAIVDLADGQLHVLDASSAPVSSLAWNPDGTRLAFACDTNTVCIADISAPQALAQSRIIRLTGHQGAVVRLAWAPGGATLASADDGHAIMIWSMHADSHVYFDLDLKSSAKAIALAGSQDQKWLAASRDDGAIVAWSAAEPEKSILLSTSTQGTAALAFSKDGALAALFPDSTIAVWRDLHRKPIVARSGLQPPEMVRPGLMAWSGDMLAYTALDGRIALVDTRKPRLAIAGFLRSTPPMAAAALSANAKSSALVASYDGGALRAWDISKRRAEPLPAPGKVAPFGIAISPDDHWAATTSGEPFVDLYDLGAHTLATRLKLERVEPGGSIAFNFDGSLLSAIDANNVLYVWDMSPSMPELFLRVSVDGYLGTRGAANYATGLVWLEPHRVAVLTGSGAVRIVNLDETQWRQRMDAVLPH